MTKPVATYRVQLNKDFNFYNLKDTVPYLAKLGISHIYASPIFEAKKGSLHGYDVLNPNKISGELGGAGAFQALNREAKAYGLEWIQDIVPNHIAYSTESDMVTDLMKKGVGSQYYTFFDVDWNHPTARLRGRILAPFLEGSYEKALNQGEIKLGYSQGVGFVIKYKSMEFPVKTELLQGLLGNLTRVLQLIGAQLDEVTTKTVEEYYKDPTNLDRLLSMQVYALAQWTVALRRINYRRFFDILDLICLHAEDIQVFEATHQLISELVSHEVSGLRIDHIDGLYDPEQYIERLRQKAPEAFMIVEKILTGKEELPQSWQVQGTTGYDFLSYVNGVFIDRENEIQVDEVYTQFTENKEPFRDLLYDCKKLVIQKMFRGDMDNLTRLVLQALHKRPYGKELTHAKVRRALVELFASFPVYRTYLNEKSVGTKAQLYFRQALLQATQRNEGVHLELEAIEKLLEECGDAQDALHVIMRLQQFTGIIMAKGFEDTALYRYNRLLSLNDVGSNPSKFGHTPEEFHTLNRSRCSKWSSTLNATSTHDTKRGEDARARLNVLSEIPVEFKQHVTRWAQLSTSLKSKIKGKAAPDNNEEYYIYQVLLSALPFNSGEVPDFIERLRRHVVKVLREAKVHSDWISPQVAYEEAVIKFAVELLSQETSKRFLEDFLPFQGKVASYGVVNSLAQTLLKITSPGVPDFYQGTELWNLTMVDPDNRRPVDFRERQIMLEEVTKMQFPTAQEMLKKPQDGKVKLYEIYKALQAVQKERALFAEGEYIPLKVEGDYKSHILAFCRRKASTYAVTVVPRLLASLTNRRPSEVEWEDTCVCLPQNAPINWQNVFTEQQHRARSATGGGRIPVNELFSTFPMSMLLSGEP